MFGDIIQINYFAGIFGRLYYIIMKIHMLAGL